jgi:O-antigen/teichoic acid export membrane protein
MGVVVAGSVSYALLLFVYATKKYNAGFEFDLCVWKKIFKKAWPLAISIMFNVVYLKGDTVLLSLFRPQSEVGIYGAAYKVIDVLAESAMMLMGLLLPLLSYAWAKNLKDKFKNRLQKSFDIMMAVALPAIAGLIMLSDKIIVLIAGNQFSTSAQILEILALALLGVFLGAIFGHTAVAINKQKKTLWVYISGAILTLIGYLIFLPKYGMFGAAWMSVFSEMYVGLLLFATIKYYTQKTFAFKTLFKIIFSTIAMTAVLYLLPNWHVLLLTAIGGIVYFIILIATGGLSIGTIKEITRLKRKEEV